MLAACSEDNTIRLIDFTEFPEKEPIKVQTIYTTHSMSTNSISFSSDNMLFVSAGNDGALNIFTF